MSKYRGGVIGLGWTGMLYDLAPRMGTWNVDDIDRPTPEVDPHRTSTSTIIRTYGSPAPAVRLGAPSGAPSSTELTPIRGERHQNRTASIAEGPETIIRERT